ncbi:CBO2463/CBO2479 domain-containing protein [Peptostreptococcaceae bacterium AGR-M142]
MDRLKYASTERMYEGVLIKITDGSVTIDLKGRLGQLKVPKRMLISDYDLKLGMEVGFLMSYPEVLSPDVNEKYKQIIEENARREKEGGNE